MQSISDLPQHDTGLSPGVAQSDLDDDAPREPAPLTVADGVASLLDRHPDSRTCAALREQAEQILADDYLAGLVRAFATGNRLEAMRLGWSLAEALHDLAKLMDVGYWAARLDADLSEEGGRR